MGGSCVRFQDDLEPNSTFGLGNTGEIGYITQLIAKYLCKFGLELSNNVGIGGSFGRTQGDRIWWCNRRKFGGPYAED